jgi:hypothetical protein
VRLADGYLVAICCKAVIRAIEWLVVAAIAVSCKERVPPPGSGALETTPTGANSAGQRGFAELPGLRHALYPNGSLMIADPFACRVSAIELGTLRWATDIANCGGLMEVAIADDSVAYVRTAKELVSLDPQGHERWRARCEEEVPRTSAAPTTMPDSRAVLVTGIRTVTAYQVDGKPAWHFPIPANEMIVGPPTGMRTEGVAVVTSQAAYALGPDGEVRWRAAITADQAFR